MRATILAGTLVLLTGCTAAFDVTGREWTRPAVTSQQVTLDQTECARAAYEAGRTPDLVLGGLLDVGRLAIQNGAQASTYRGCMTDRGYRPTSA
ncbi:MAG: hypothetical protein ACREJ9_16140 [Candidatus Rokuibacteriota bacterium]